MHCHSADEARDDRVAVPSATEGKDNNKTKTVSTTTWLIHVLQRSRLSSSSSSSSGMKLNLLLMNDGSSTWVLQRSRLHHLHHSWLVRFQCFRHRKLAFPQLTHTQQNDVAEYLQCTTYNTVPLYQLHTVLA